MPISQNTYTVPNNFVQQYDLGQKKIRADLVDENFTDAAGAINTLLTDDANTVHLTGAETVSGNKTFSGDVTFTGDVDLSNADVTGADFVPVGTIIWSANSTVPAGYLLCNGSAVGRATYPELFAAIGTAFGSGDGSTTFNLPNLIDRFIEGSNVAGTVKAAGLPNITGAFGTIPTQNASYWGVGSGSGAFYSTLVGVAATIGNTGTTNRINNTIVLDASRSSSIYGNSDTVQPPAVTALPCIKAFSGVIGSATVVAGQLVNEIQSKVALDGSNTSSIGSTLSTYMAHAAMPSGQYEDLTLPASEQTITAPADGWVFLRKVAGVQNAYCMLSSYEMIYDETYYIMSSRGDAPLSTNVINIYIPVSKGQLVRVAYSATGTTNYFRFVYANGSAS